MATTTLTKVSVNMKLNNGQDAQGNTKLVSLSLGSLSKDNFNVDKALAVIGLLEPCLNKTIEAVEKVEISSITAA